MKKINRIFQSSLFGILITFALFTFINIFVSLVMYCVNNYGDTSALLIAGLSIASIFGFIFYQDSKPKKKRVKK